MSKLDEEPSILTLLGIDDERRFIPEDKPEIGWWRVETEWLKGLRQGLKATGRAADVDIFADTRTAHVSRHPFTGLNDYSGNTLLKIEFWGDVPVDESRGIGVQHLRIIKAFNIYGTFGDALLDAASRRLDDPTLSDLARQKGEECYRLLANDRDFFGALNAFRVCCAVGPDGNINTGDRSFSEIVVPIIEQGVVDDEQI